MSIINNPKHLESEIIHQKKQLIFKVEQTTNHTFPNEDYKYYIYLKNISGVPIENIHVKVNNPDTIIFNEEYGEDGYINIGTLKNEEVKLIYLKANCQATGKHYVHFICYGDGTGLYYKSLIMLCSYVHSSDELIHRLHIYDFTPYEDTFSMKIKNFSNQVTQLFKTQKLPFKAGEQPFHMEMKDSESNRQLFSNTEPESFIQQNDILKNTKEHVYQYISRENFNENSIESYEGENLIDLIRQVNEHSNLFKAKYLQSGTNKLRTNLYQYEPNGFIHRFGLLNSEIYHYLGTLPTYSYMSDYLFRWAPDGKEPLNLYPQKVAMQWEDKKWAGRGWVLYRISTPEFIESQDFDPKTDTRWKIIGHFRDKHSAETMMERELFADEIIKNQTNLSYDKYQYEIRESYFDTGVFFVHIPINKIPSNFYLLDTTEIESLIQRAKPFGTKPLIRYLVEETFEHHMDFTHYPIFKPYIDIDMSDIEFIPYFIQSKKYQTIVEEKCGTNIKHYGLIPYGKTEIFEYPLEADMGLEYQTMSPTIVKADITNELKTKDIRNCKNNQQCIEYVKKKKSYPDNSFNHNLEQYIDMNETKIDNNLKTLQGVGNLLYQNNFENIAFFIPTMGFKNYTLQNNVEDELNVTQWMNNNQFKAFGCKIERNIIEVTDEFVLTTQQIKANTFKIPLTDRSKINQGNETIGIGFTDTYNRYHLFTLQYNKIYQKDYLQYATVYNNNFKLKKDGLSNASSLIIKFVKINGDYKNIIAIFFIEQDENLHYFHHVVCSNPSEIFIFMSNNLAYETILAEGYYYKDDLGHEQLITPIGKRTYVKTDEDGNNHIIKGNIKYEEKLIDNFNKFLTHANKNNDIVTFETPQYYEFEQFTTNNVFDGGNWTNLYRINKEENSYTYIQNKTNTIQNVDDIILHFDNINIPEKAEIKDIRLKTILSSSHSRQIFCETSYQNNYIIKDAIGNNLKLASDNIECYHQSKESQYYYQTIINQTNNTEKIKYYTNLINDNIIFHESLEMDDEIIITNPFWIETTQFSDIPYDCNNINNIELVIEGFNNGPEVNLLSQLLYELDGASSVSTKIDNGYFFKKITLPFSNNFLIDWLRLRFRFESLNDTVQIFNYYLNITFKNKEEFNLEFEETDYINNQNKNIHYLDLYTPNLTAPEINNGVTVRLSFDDLNPGEEYKIYSNELQIEYKNPDMNLIINKDKFYSTEQDSFVAIGGKAQNAYLSGSFYTDANYISQIYSDVNADNLGVELRDSVYQASTLTTDNITAIQIYPNGFKGSPDATLKIGIYENRGSTPGKLIKEVYANGWSKTNKTLKNLNNIKYEINVDGLTPNKIYWFKLEVENPSKNNYYLLKYTTTQRREYKLLLKENNNYINISGSLEFSIYSKDLTESFSELPTIQDYLVNPYIKIGLHKGQGTIKNLTVKKKTNQIQNRVIFNGNF